MSQIELKKGSFLSDGVTISKLLPMKPIPFKIIYILGLNEDIFPEYKSQSSLDLRIYFDDYISKTEVDNYLFLETIMCCQEKLYLTYTSKDLEKDAILYPSSVIKDIVLYLNENLLEKKFEIFEATVNMEDDRNFIDCNNIYTDIYRCNIKEKIDLKSNFLNFSFNENKIKKFNYEPKEKEVINIIDLQRYLFEPKKILLKNKLKVDLERFDKLQIENIETFYVDRFYKKRIFLDLLFNDNIQINEYNKYIYYLDIEEFYKKFAFSKIEQYEYIIKEYVKDKVKKEEKIKNIFSNNNYYESIKIDFLNPDNCFIFEPYQKDNFFIVGEIKDVFILNNNIYFFDLYEDKILNKENIIVNPSFKKDIYNTLLLCSLLNKKRDSCLNYNYISIDDNSINIFSLEQEEASKYFDNVLADYIRDITTECEIIDLDFNILNSNKGRIEFDDYKRVVEYNKEEYNNYYFKIEDEKILLKDNNFSLTKELFDEIYNRRYDIINKIKIK